mgnify:CR=1 FL=1
MIWLCKLPLSIRFRHILTYIKEVMNDGIDIKKTQQQKSLKNDTEDNTAIKLGSGKSPVYATPALEPHGKRSHQRLRSPAPGRL